MKKEIQGEVMRISSKAKIGKKDVLKISKDY